MSRNQYLKKQGNTWHVLVQVPARLRKAAGCWAYIKTLQTQDINEANRRKHDYVALFKRKIEALERGDQTNDLVAQLHEKALAWNKTLERAKGQVIHQHPDGPEYLTDFFLGEISDEAREIEEEHGEKAAEMFFRAARGEGTPPLRTQIDQWLAEQLITEHTKAQHRTVLSRFLKWAGHDTTVSDVTRRRAGEYRSHLLSPAAGIARTTARRYVSSLSALWTWLEQRGVTDNNPWLRLGLGKKATRGQIPPRRQQWTDGALVKVLSGPYTTRYQNILHDLVRLALVTGARLDELCARKVADVEKRADGWWLHIREGKTNAAIRTVPVHESAAHVLERRTAAKGDQEFLFDNLGAGEYGKRSWNVSKTFSRYTRTLGLKAGERQTFHSLRKSFVEVMEAKEVPLTTIELLIGHERKSLAFNTYSLGQRVNLREAINKLEYSDSVMALIRQPSQATEDIDTTEEAEGSRTVIERAR
jgi:integrase